LVTTLLISMEHWTGASFNMLKSCWFFVIKNKTCQ